MEKITNILDVKAISKSFGPTKALDNVSMSIRYGEIHGLIGENGSGKSTLSSIIAAAQNRDSGEIYLNGNPYNPKTVVEANSQRVCMVVQEQGTFEQISVAANIFVGKEHLYCNKIGVLNKKKMHQDAQKVLDDIGASHIKADHVTGDLSFEDRKLIEIARSIYSQPHILIIDESTTALSKSGREILYSQIKHMREQGQSIIFISHDIEEIISLCDALTVLRDGHFIATLEKSEFDEQRIKNLMVGREVSGHYYREDYQATRDEKVLLTVENLIDKHLNDVSFKIHAGEIVGVGGLTDCGMHDLGKALFGLLTPDSGSVRHHDGNLIDSPRTAMNHLIAYISKDRDREALMTSASIRDNICLPNLRQLEKYGLILPRSEQKFVEKWVKTLSIKMNNMDQFVMYLSGGNKQKVSVSKWLGFGADIFIFDCPTRGIDIGVKQAIYQLLIDLKKRGKAILMISEELPELIGMSDRVLIMMDGRISGEFSRDEMLTENKLIQYMI